MPTLETFQNQLRRSKPLTREQEQTATPHQLIMANLKFACSIAQQYQNRGIDFDDLIQLANLGLVTAAERFDPSTGNKFITYAVWWIRQAILEAIGDPGLIHLPRNRYENGERLFVSSLDKPINRHDPDSQTDKDLLLDEGPGPDQLAEENDAAAFVAAQLDRLNEDDRMILDAYFGLTGEERTFDEIAQTLGISKERVRQRKERAVARLWMM